MVLYYTLINVKNFDHHQFWLSLLLSQLEPFKVLVIRKGFFNLIKHSIVCFIYFFCFHRCKQGDFLHIKGMLGCFHFEYAQSYTSLHITNKLNGNPSIVVRVTQLKIFNSLFYTIA